VEAVQADESTRSKLQSLWDAAGLGPLSEPE